MEMDTGIEKVPRRDFKDLGEYKRKSRKSGTLIHVCSYREIAEQKKISKKVLT